MTAPKQHRITRLLAEMDSIHGHEVDAIRARHSIESRIENLRRSLATDPQDEVSRVIEEIDNHRRAFRVKVSTAAARAHISPALWRDLTSGCKRPSASVLLRMAWGVGHRLTLSPEPLEYSLAAERARDLIHPGLSDDDFERAPR